MNRRIRVAYFRQALRTLIYRLVKRHDMLVELHRLYTTTKERIDQDMPHALVPGDIRASEFYTDISSMLSNLTIWIRHVNTRIDALMDAHDDPATVNRWFDMYKNKIPISALADLKRAERNVVIKLFLPVIEVLEILTFAGRDVLLRMDDIS